MDRTVDLDQAEVDTGLGSYMNVAYLFEFTDCTGKNDGVRYIEGESFMVYLSRVKSY